MFHVKQKKMFLDLNKSINKNYSTSFFVDGFELIPFVVSKLGGPVVLLVKQPFFDDVFSSFNSSQNHVVGLPLIPKKEKHVLFSSHYKKLFDNGYYQVLHNLKHIKILVVEESLFKKPLFSVEKTSFFQLAGKNITLESLVSFLCSGGYIKVDLILSSVE